MARGEVVEVVGKYADLRVVVVVGFLRRTLHITIGTGWLRSFSFRW